MLRVLVRDLIKTQSMQMNSLSRTLVWQGMILSQKFKLLSNYRAELGSKETSQE